MHFGVIDSHWWMTPAVCDPQQHHRRHIWRSQEGWRKVLLESDLTRS